MARGAHDVPGDRTSREAVDSADDALASKFWRFRISVAAALRAAAVGTLAPVLSCLLIGVAISLTASVIFISARADISSAQERSAYATP